MNLAEEKPRNAPASEGHGRNFDEYWSEIDHFRVDDDEDEDDRVAHQNPEEQDADWLREVGLDFVLDDVLGGSTSGGHQQAQHQQQQQPPAPDAVALAARSYVRTLSREQAAAVQRRLDTVTLRRRRHQAPRLDVRHVFDSRAPSQKIADDASDGRRGELRVTPSAPAGGRAQGPLWKNHWHQYDAIATRDVKGVAVLGFKMKGTLRGPPPEPPPPLAPLEDEEDEDEQSLVAVRPGVDWTLQPGFSDSFGLESHDQELPVSVTCGILLGSC